MCARLVSGRRTGYIKAVYNVFWTVVKFQNLRMTQLVKISCLKLWECLLTIGAECLLTVGAECLLTVGAECLLTVGAECLLTVGAESFVFQFAR